MLALQFAHLLTTGLAKAKCEALLLPEDLVLFCDGKPINLLFTPANAG